LAACVVLEVEVMVLIVVVMAFLLTYYLKGRLIGCFHIFWFYLGYFGMLEGSDK